MIPRGADYIESIFLDGNFHVDNDNTTDHDNTGPRGGGGGSLASICAGYLRLASQNPYPNVVYFWSILWPIIDPS